jgi:imidazole glycerol phosphate synthase subunit HisF
MAFSVYHNPQNVTINSSPITGVQSIVLSVRCAEIHADGDADTHESVARYTTGRTRGVITLLDPTSADSVQGETGTLSFTWKDVKGSGDKTVTVANCSVGGYDATVSRDAASAVSLPFIAESAPVIS